jgi:hypothetical protein
MTSAAVPLIPLLVDSDSKFDFDEEAYAHSLKPSPQLQPPRNNLYLMWMSSSCDRIIEVEKRCSVTE